MATGVVKSLHIYRVKRLQQALYPSMYFVLNLKKSFLTTLRFVEIIVKNLKFDAKAYFISNSRQYCQEAPPVGGKISNF